MGGSRRLLALAGDRRLGDLVRAGNEAAFEVVFERHGPPVLSFCRHMLGSHEEAEDAVQQTFASAHRALVGSDRPVELKPWLFTIARNRCLSMLRTRRPESAALEVPATAGLHEDVERRADLRELLRDLGELPEDQRAALVLAALGDLSHPQIGEILGVETARVKAIVFRARAGLIERREARSAPCEEIREELATLSRGALRRNRLRYHVRHCAGCSDFRDEVRRQRSLMAIVLPVMPSAGLKAAVLGAVGAGGAGAGGALTAAGLAGGLSGLLGAGSAGSAGLAKLAVAGVLIGGAGTLGEALESDPPARHSDRARATRHAGAAHSAVGLPARVTPVPPRSRRAGPAARALERRGGARGELASGGRRRAAEVSRSAKRQRRRKRPAAGRPQATPRGRSIPPKPRTPPAKTRGQAARPQARPDRPAAPPVKKQSPGARR